MKKIKFIILLTFTITNLFAQVQWQENGVPVRQGENIQWNQTSVACEDGAFVSIWTDTRAGNRGIYAQKVDENGDLLWDNDGIEIYNPARIQTEPIAISSTDNSVIVCWRDHDEDETYLAQLRLQKISANGELLWGEEGVLLGESGTNNYLAQLIPHNEGGVYILWKTQSNLHAIRLLADGSIASGWEQGINLSAYFFDASSDGLNGVIVAYSVDDDIYLQRLDENGNKLWGYFGTLLFNGEGFIREVKICSSIIDEYYVSWRSTTQTYYNNILMQKIDITGYPTWNTPITISEENFFCRLWAVCSSGSQPIVTWVDGNAIFSQKIDSNGNFLWGEDGILVFESNYNVNNDSVILKADSFDGCVISWVDYDNSYDESKIIAQKVNEDGNLIFNGDGVIIFESDEYNYYNLFSSLVLSDQKYYFCWLNNSSNPQSLKHQIVDDDGNIYLEENGEDMYTGISGGAYDIKLLPNENNPIMLWVDERDRNNSQIYLQKLTDNGNNCFAEDGIPITTETGSDQQELSAAYGENSETIAAVWVEEREVNYQIFTQGIDTAGNFLWSDSTGIALTQSDNWAENPKISIFDNAGNDEFYIGWEDWSDIRSPHIYGQKIIDGEKQWGENGVLVAEDDYECALVDVVDRFYIWDGGNWPYNYLTVKLLDESGNTAPGWPEEGVEIFYNSNYSSDYKLELIPSGLFVSWLDHDADTIYGQIIDYEGNILWQEDGIPLTDATETSNFNVIYNEYIYLVWDEWENDHYVYYMQKFNEDGEALWQEGGILLSHWSEYHRSDPALESVGDNVLVVWEHSYTGQSSQINAQLITPEGYLQYNLPALTICDQIMDRSSPEVYLFDDNAYICWRDERSTIMGDEGLVSVPGLYAQKLHLEPTLADDDIVTTGENILLSNYPNPFNPSSAGRSPTTTISFNLTTESTEHTELIIYNLKGQKVKQLISDQLTAGQQTVVWNGKDDEGKPVSSGVYFYQLNIGDKVIDSKKCLLLK